MGSLYTIKRNAHEKILKLKRLEYILETQLFEHLWNLIQTNEKELNAVKTLVLFHDVDGIQNWMENKIGLESLSLDKLKHKAKLLRIFNWSRLTKSELILEIRHYEKTKEKEGFTGNLAI
jgi:hypothetical protein